jgi:hypothetical protein
MISAKDLEELDVFRFFHYPRQIAPDSFKIMTDIPDTLATPSARREMFWKLHKHTSSAARINPGDSQGEFPAADPKSDWLDFQEPYDLKPHYL